MALTIFFILTFNLCQAPAVNAVYVAEGEPINPYKRLIFAIGMVESRNNDSAINYSEFSYGRYQVRAIRLKDYQRQTGIRYSLTDMQDSAKATKVLMFYVHQIGPYDFERCSRDWNGGSNGMKIQQTVKYWNQIKLYL